MDNNKFMPGNNPVPQERKPSNSESQEHSSSYLWYMNRSVNSEASRDGVVSILKGWIDDVQNDSKLTSEEKDELVKKFKRDINLAEGMDFDNMDDALRERLSKLVDDE